MSERKRTYVRCAECDSGVNTSDIGRVKVTKGAYFKYDCPVCGSNVMSKVFLFDGDEDNIKQLEGVTWKTI